MTKEYRYILEKVNKKTVCRNCGKKTFVRYIDTGTGDYIPEQYGRCDREIKCAYHLNPYRDGYAQIIREQKYKRVQKSIICKPTPPKKPEPAFVPVAVLRQTLSPEGYKKNVFIQNLLTRVQFPFESKDVEKIISQYYLGTACNGYRAGAITFPFIDKSGNIRAIQVKQFDEENHTIGTDFLHSIIGKHHQKKNEALPDWVQAYQHNETKVSCLFGEHLLNKYTLNPIALVEAPKTAIYSTLYFGFPEKPENLLWLAVYNLSSLNFDKCQALQGRDVYLFPDLSSDGKAFELWSNKAREISDLMPGTRFKVSELLETLAPNELRNDGADIADVLIKIDWRKFKPQESESIRGTERPTPEYIPTFESEKGEKSEGLKQTYFSQSERPKLESWEQDITELEQYYKAAKLPTGPVKLNHFSTILNVTKFIESHFTAVKGNEGKRAFLPYLHRLQELKQYLTINHN